MSSSSCRCELKASPADALKPFLLPHLHPTLSQEATVLRRPDGSCRGFGFVTFDDEVAVEKCLVQEHHIAGRRVDCKRAIGQGEVAPSGPGGGGGMHQMGGRGGGGSSAPVDKTQDWVCAECSNSNPGWRHTCTRCGSLCCTVLGSCICYSYSKRCHVATWLFNADACRHDAPARPALMPCRPLLLLAFARAGVERGEPTGLEAAVVAAVVVAAAPLLPKRQAALEQRQLGAWAWRAWQAWAVCPW